MENISTTNQNSEPINVFLVGNNPVELSSIYDRLSSFKGRKYIAEIAFDLKNILNRVIHFNASCIVIDDNIGRKRISKLIKSLTRNKRTKDIPIALLKNSNYTDVPSDGVQDFILKDHATSEALSKTLLNAIKLRRTKIYLYKTYKKSKGQIASFFSKD
ncbi:MAG: hypothetical protein AAFX87_06415 [Bacteroidota bacterium]